MDVIDALSEFDAAFPLPPRIVEAERARELPSLAATAIEGFLAHPDRGQLLAYARDAIRRSQVVDTSRLRDALPTMSQRALDDALFFLGSLMLDGAISDEWIDPAVEVCLMHHVLGLRACLLRPSVALLERLAVHESPWARWAAMDALIDLLRGRPDVPRAHELRLVARLSADSFVPVARAAAHALVDRTINEKIWALRGQPKAASKAAREEMSRHRQATPPTFDAFSLSFRQRGVEPYTPADLDAFIAV